MLVTFSRQTGRVVSLSESLDTFNTKTIKIKDVSLIKYISMTELSKTNKTDRLNRPVYDYMGGESPLVTKIYKSTKGEQIYNSGNIQFYDCKSSQVENLKNIQIYDTIGKYVSFPKEFNEFSVDEVIAEYYQLLLEESECSYAMADNFSALKNILIGESTFKSIQQREIVLAPGNELKLKSENLAISANTFKILDINKDVTVFINDIEIDTIQEFKKPIDKINISFKNNTTKDIILDTFMIGYSLSQE